MRCPACSARVADDAAVCGSCGRKLREDDAKKTMMGIPAMGADEGQEEEAGDEDSARSTLFGIPAASREGNKEGPPRGPRGRAVQDDATPVPDNYQGEGDARTQVADKEQLSNALRDSGQQDSARSTMFGLPKADAESEDEGDDIASQWGLGEESDEGEAKTMVASGDILDAAVDSKVGGEGTGYSKPQADVDPNVQTLMGMHADPDAEAEDGYGDYDDSTQALSAEELEQFEQRIKSEDGLGTPGGGSQKRTSQGGPAQQHKPEPDQQPFEQSPDQQQEAAGSNRRRSLLQKLKKRTEDEAGEQPPRSTASGIPAAQRGDKPQGGVGHENTDERAASGPRFSIPTPGDDAPVQPSGPETDEQESGYDDETRVRTETPRSGVLSPKKAGSKTEVEGGKRSMLESSSSYRISGSSDPQLEGRESPAEPDPGPPARTPHAQDPGPRTGFPISDSKPEQPHQGGPDAGMDGDKTAVLDEDGIQELALDDTAAIGGESEPGHEAIDGDDLEALELDETSVADANALAGEFDQSGAAVPGEFADAAADASTSGVVQPGGSSAGVQQPAGSSSGVIQPDGSGVSEPEATSGVVQPGESSGVVQPDRGSGLQKPSDGGLGVIQPDGPRAGGSGVIQPEDSGAVQSESSKIEPPVSSTQSGGFGVESDGSRGQAGNRTSPNFGATPAGTSNAGVSDRPDSGQQGGFGAQNVPNPSSQQMSTQSRGNLETIPPDEQQADQAGGLENTIRVVFAVIGALVTMGAGGAALAQGAMELPPVEMGIFLSPLAIGLLTLGVGALPLSGGIKSAGLVLMTLLTGAALAGAILFEAAPVVMLLLVGGTLLTLCSAAFPALVKMIK